VKLPPSTALVVVDVQNGFISRRSEHIVPTIVDTVRTWQQHGGPTIFTRFINAPDSPFERLIHWTRLREAPETELVDDLKPYAEHGYVIDKPSYSLFTGEAAELLHQQGWTDLLICGIATESCVCKTAVDAFERGFTPWVLTDACASHAGQVAHDAGLLVTERFIGKGQMITRADALEPLYAVGA
jgi:nicotinamidase-related amidase